ncbi:DUF6221 family protein [Streptomyces pacificus]|uniref:DUF6221 family protein n=1 Tax=Streptomyces pacificus TaxID=2705029 RepID=UPI0015668687|nr:DUF6221 family protein [Streptomyces pacificus]
MNDLVQFLREQYDEEADAARQACWDDDASGRWTAHHREEYDGRWVIIDGMDEGVTEVRPQAADDGPVARHIARHDPARVLREVEAKRRILREHRQDSLPDGIDLEECYTCGGVNERWPCPTLRLLALPYADHPNYRQKWKP